MLSTLLNDSMRWRDSDDRRRRMRYTESRIHQDRSRASRGLSDPRSQSTRHESHGSTANGAAYGTPPIAVPQRPALPQRNSSSSGSAIESVASSPISSFESPSWQNGRSFSSSTSSSTQHRRPSEAMAPSDFDVISRTISGSSDSSDFGTKGGFGWYRGQQPPPSSLPGRR